MLARAFTSFWIASPFRRAVNGRPAYDLDLKQNLLQVVFSKRRPNRVGHLPVAFVFRNPPFDSFQHFLQVERSGATLAALLGRNGISFVPSLQLFPFADNLLQRFSGALPHLFGSETPELIKIFLVTGTRSFLLGAGPHEKVHIFNRGEPFSIDLLFVSAGNYTLNISGGNMSQCLD